MKKYKGYYIDHVVFNNEADIDAFIEKQAVEKFKILNQIFYSHMSLEASIACSNQALILNTKFGYSWDRIEQLELEAIA